MFFIDESQRVTINDIGSIGEIEKWAEKLGADIYYNELVSQFRCNGSEGYIAWIDDVLDIRPTANFDMKDIDYDIRIVDTHRKCDLIVKKTAIQIELESWQVIVGTG